MSSLSLHTLSLSLSLSLSPHPTESTRPCTGATETTKEQFFPPFPILSRYLLYLSIGHSWNERRRDRAAHGFHPPNEKELRSSISPGSTGESSPDLSKGTSFSLSLLPHVSMQIPQAKGPDYTRSTQRILSLQRTQQPTQQEVRRVEEEEEREKKYTRRGGRGGTDEGTG